MKAYSEDLRLRVVAAVDGGMPRAAVARVFEVGSATITRYLRLRRETGGLGPRPRHGPPSIKTAALRAELLPRLEAQPDATLEEHCAWWAETAGVRVSRATCGRAIPGHLGCVRTQMCTPPV